MSDGARLPDTFIVGAPKAGTTSLYEYLRHHPQVFMSPTKEPGYFAPDVPGTRRHGHPYRFEQDARRYRELFAGATARHTRLGEASSSYLMSPRAPALIHEFNPDARIIVMVRNPVDLIHSLHAERVARGSEWITDFEQALTADDDRRAGRRLPRDAQGFGVAYRDNAFLGAQLEHWYRQFSAERVHLVVFDDFSRDVAAELKRVLRFLEVDPEAQLGPLQVHNPSRRRRKGIASSIAAHPAARWTSRTLLPALVGRRAAGRVVQRLGVQRLAWEAHDRVPLSPELRRQLEAEFAADVDKLGTLLGRDLRGAWFTRDGTTPTAVEGR